MDDRLIGGRSPTRYHCATETGSGLYELLTDLADSNEYIPGGLVFPMSSPSIQVGVEAAGSHKAANFRGQGGTDTCGVHVIALCLVEHGLCKLTVGGIQSKLLDDFMACGCKQY